MSDEVRRTRPMIVGQEEPQAPYPLKLESTIIAGFGRGSSDLGFPTANISVDDFETLPVTDTGIYYGYAQVHENNDEDLPCYQGSRENVVYNYGKDMATHERHQVLPMVMSVGWNPFYNNKKKSAEVYIIHDFQNGDFYGAKIKLIIAGYIRQELDYVSRDALIHDINTDVKVTLNSLDRPAYAKLQHDEWFSN